MRGQESISRTIAPYMSLVGFIAVVLKTAGANAAGLVALMLTFLLLILGVSRLASAGMAVRRWRAGQ